MTFTAEMLSRPPEQIIATAVHETVHLWMHDTGEKGVSKGGRHNKLFKENAEQAGLVVADPHNARGFAYTSLSDELREAIEKEFLPDYAALGLFRNLPEATESKKTTKAYICDCEGDDLVTLRVSVGKELDATCGKCSAQYVLKDE